ncbi:MAG: isoprenylcysteine carboxylmethyltransferase family protein [Anaerolineae bacterium]|jgi:protein-S-isoprenylcysteine O-methyltransferase Ste14
MAFKLVIFVVATAGILYISRASLQSLRAHGFYRFFAWEAILVLTLLNLDVWFDKPFSLPQSISWLCLCISLFLVIRGVQLLRVVGKPDDGRRDTSLLGIEKTTALVTVGLYKYIRHPLYSSLFFLAWGVFFKSPSWIGSGLVAVAMVCLTATAKVEETENIRYFGEAYGEYMKKTKMFIPFVL